MATLDAIFADEVPFPTPVIGQGEMSLDNFVEALQAAEQANSGDTTSEFITRFRQLYYPGTGSGRADLPRGRVRSTAPRCAL